MRPTRVSALAMYPGPPSVSLSTRNWSGSRGRYTCGSLVDMSMGMTTICPVRSWSTCDMLSWSGPCRSRATVAYRMTSSASPPYSRAARLNAVSAAYFALAFLTARSVLSASTSAVKRAARRCLACSSSSVVRLRAYGHRVSFLVEVHCDAFGDRSKVEGHGRARVDPWCACYRRATHGIAILDTRRSILLAIDARSC
eukprot:3534497-Prymnesium_polylepis.1